MKIASWIVVVLVAALVILFLAWSRVPDMLATRLSQKMKVSVTIDDINLSPAAVKVRKLEIGNPRGSILSKAFSAGLIDVKAPLMRYLNQDIVVDEIHIDKIYLGLEFENAKGTQGNWTTIMGNLESSTKQPANAKETKPGKQRTVFIKRLLLTNIDTDVVYRQEGGKIRHLRHIDSMEIDNISSQGGFPIDQLMDSVLGQMLKQVFIQQNLKNMLENLLNQPQGQIQQYLQPFKRFLPAVDLGNKQEEKCA